MSTDVLDNSLTGPIRPFRRTSGRNSSGPIGPRCGWVQRSSASTPTMSPVRRSTFG